MRNKNVSTQIYEGAIALQKQLVVANARIAQLEGLMPKITEQQSNLQRVRQLMVRVHNKLSGATKDPSLFGQIDEELQESGWDDESALNILLSKERERCAKHLEEQISYSDADDEIDICIGQTLCTAVAQIRSIK